jgi:hypothetical protein
MLRNINEHFDSISRESRRFVNGKRPKHHRPSFTRSIKTLPSERCWFTRGKGKSSRACGIQLPPIEDQTCPDPDNMAWINHDEWAKLLMPDNPMRQTTIHDIAMDVIHKDDPKRFMVIKALAECYRDARRSRHEVLG